MRKKIDGLSSQRESMENEESAMHSNVPYAMIANAMSTIGHYHSQGQNTLSPLLDS